MPNPFDSRDEIIVKRNVPVFAPKKIVELDSDMVFTPETSDLAFYANADTTYTLNGGSTYIELLQAQVIGIRPGVVFTFSTDVKLAVM